ncbi:MAG: TIGR03960 family B12-binding radical SAM protein [Eubacteriales bacterium]
MDARLEKILPLVQKPGRYIGGELNSVEKDPSTVDMRFAFCFPDTYEIGMSHLGIKILYYLINEREDAYCERVFAPWLDMEEQMRKVGLPLFTLETGTPLSEFDLIGFTLQYEMSFTTCLYMLELGGVPLLAKDRHGLENLVVGGGPCACNPEPIADFFDLFMLGDGEEVMMDLLDLYKEYKEQGASREEFLKAASHIGGIYVPSLYDVSYNEDGTVQSVSPVGDAPAVVRKRVVADLDSAYYPDKFLVPYIDIVHDRAVEEIYRGCIRGCRFCQAGFLYRPIREKSVDTINAQAKSLCESTGYDEISVISLSTSDYSGIQPLLSDMADWTAEQKINISLPSLRIDTFSDELVEKLNLIRRSGLTFAPEAGSQRMRDVINKNITEEDIMKSVRIAFANNYATVKLYFMLGLPYETMEDVEAIVDLGKQIVDAFYQNPDRVKGRHLTVNISASPFVPKPFTPFQWEPQDTKASIEEKQERLHELAAKTRLHISSHHSDTIFLEAAFARGDRRLCKVIRKAFEKGCYFDSWDNCFDIDKWMEAFEECGLDPAFYSNRRRSYDEVLPWDHLDNGPSKEFLIRENEKAKEAAVTPNCREQCSNCGAQRLNDGKCDALLKIDRGREAV